MATFSRLLTFLRPYRALVVLSALLAAGAMVMTVLIPWLVGRGIDHIDSGDRHGLNTVALLVAAAGVGRLLLTIVRRLVAGIVSLGVEQDLRSSIYRHLLALELGFFDRQQTGQLMSRATVDLQSVRFFLGYGLVLILQAALTLVLASVAMFLVDWRLAAISLLPMPLVIAIARRYGRLARPAQQEVQQRIAELTAVAEESISGVRVIKAFAAEERRRSAFTAATGRVFDQEMVAVRLTAFFQPLIGFLPQIGLACVLLLGGRSVISGSITLGAFTAFYSYLLMMIGPTRSLGMSLGLAQRATASGARLFEILDRAPRITSAPGAPPLPAGGGAVRFNDVSFGYEGAPGPALQGIGLEIAAGRTVALVGTTGSGKTTLVALLARLYEATSGTIEIDGADIRSVDTASLRSQIAVVDDAPFLFSATVAENIAYARPEATRAEVEQAARHARADTFIRALPDGYDTKVGERGLTLSGGQRQRVAIARALLAQPRILILDDATSAVDASTEQQIKEALREVMDGRTTFVIAHRLSTIALADEIVVLEDGRVAAHGDHETLLGISPLYSQIVEKGLPDQVFLNRVDEESAYRDALGTAR